MPGCVGGALGNKAVEGLQLGCSRGRSQGATGGTRGHLVTPFGPRIALLSNLEVLDVHQNKQLAELPPAALAKLTKLKKLDASSCQLAGESQSQISRVVPVVC